MSTANGSTHRYTISISQTQQDHLRLLWRAEQAQGTGDEFAARLLEIFRQLRSSPQTFGKLLYRLPALELDLCLAIVGRFIIDYGVNERKKVVFSRGFRMYCL